MAFLRAQVYENKERFLIAESYAQLRVSTSKTEKELDHWLWATNHGCDYVGVFEVRA